MRRFGRTAEKVYQFERVGSVIIVEQFFPWNLIRAKKSSQIHHYPLTRTRVKTQELCITRAKKGAKWHMSRKRSRDKTAYKHTSDTMIMSLSATPNTSKHEHASKSTYCVAIIIIIVCCRRPAVYFSPRVTMMMMSLNHLSSSANCKCHRQQRALLKRRPLCLLWELEQRVIIICARNHAANVSLKLPVSLTPRNWLARGQMQLTDMNDAKSNKPQHAQPHELQLSARCHLCVLFAHCAI